MKLINRENELIYFALSRLLDNTDGYSEANEIINLRTKFEENE